ncbi:MAG: sigma 54-interacting transcriptional regulator, partial [Vicinamibacterales bacterium]
VEQPQAPSLDAITLKAIEQLAPLAANPEVLGREVLSVLLRSHCVTQARLSRDATESSAAPTSIPLGRFLGQHFRIDASPHPTPAALETFVTVRNVVGLIVASSEQRHREALRSALWQFEPSNGDEGPLVRSAVMQQVLATIGLLSQSDVPVLLTGETGTGKEVFARELHRLSRAKGPFVPFNCTAVAADMLDAQLFGHRRGAFTGAIENVAGIVRSASHGTLFLDEIGELDLELQPKLLRLLDRAEVQPLGEAHPIAVRVRLVAATNAPIDAMKAAGRFREDLYYRLNVGRVHIPPLRERREEIPPLAERFLEQHARTANRARLTLSDEAVEALLLCRWPGNVRQLASEMRRLVALCQPGSVVRPHDLSDDVRGRVIVPPGAGPAEAHVSIPLDQPLDAAIEQLERALITHALGVEGGHMDRVATRLGLSRKGLFLKRRRLGVA